MTRVRVANFSVSLDGYGAGPDQTRETPLGVGGEELHEWVVATADWLKSHGKEGGTTGADNDFARIGMENLGAWIMGRNMFGPVRGAWPDYEWKGWWGKNPPYHVPVFVLSHHERPAQEMEGGTVFHFVTGGIHEAMERARDAAAGKDIRIGGGASTVNQYLRERMIDELHIAVAPVFLGSGERLYDGVNMRALGYECTRMVSTEKATHLVITKQGR